MIAGTRVKICVDLKLGLDNDDNLHSKFFKQIFVVGLCSVFVRLI